MLGTAIAPALALRGSWDKGQIPGDKPCSCHAKHGAGPCIQPEAASLPSLGSPCVFLCAFPTTGPPVWPPCCPGAGGGGLSLLRHHAPPGCGEKGAGPPRQQSLPAPLPPSDRERPRCREASPRAAARHSPWCCRLAMHRLPRRSPFPALHLGLKYL